MSIAKENKVMEENKKSLQDFEADDSLLDAVTGGSGSQAQDYCTQRFGFRRSHVFQNGKCIYCGKTGG